MIDFWFVSSKNLLVKDCLPESVAYSFVSCETHLYSLYYVLGEVARAGDLDVNSVF